MTFGFSGGASSSTTKSHTWIDPWTRDAQRANYAGAQQIAPTYTPTGAAQIGQYQNPYVDQVVDRSGQALEKQRQMAVNTMSDQAQAAHAFGGSRHGVAEALTNQGYAEQAAQMASQLYSQSYAQALAAAQNENQYAYQYPLQRQAMLNQSLGQITPETFSKGRQSGWEMNGWVGERKQG